MPMRVLACLLSTAKPVLGAAVTAGAAVWAYAVVNFPCAAFDNNATAKAVDDTHASRVRTLLRSSEACHGVRDIVGRKSPRIRGDHGYRCGLHRGLTSLVPVPGVFPHRRGHLCVNQLDFYVSYLSLTPRTRPASPSRVADLLCFVKERFEPSSNRQKQKR
jgi:hypothetical protein